ncbi:hypothetical protein GCM10010176_097120 [Nonomuraea spiralis]|nr:hypothetical protein GCM10010176_097120 [Nonomuraea spiralis]
MRSVGTAGAACGARPGVPPPSGTGPQAARPDGGRAEGRGYGGAPRRRLISYECNPAMALGLHALSDLLFGQLSSGRRLNMPSVLVARHGADSAWAVLAATGRRAAARPATALRVPDRRRRAGLETVEKVLIRL